MNLELLYEPYDPANPQNSYKKIVYILSLTDFQKLEILKKLSKMDDDIIMFILNSTEDDNILKDMIVTLKDKNYDINKIIKPTSCDFKFEVYKAILKLNPEVINLIKIPKEEIKSLASLDNILSILEHVEDENIKKEIILELDDDKKHEFLLKNPKSISEENLKAFNSQLICEDLYEKYIDILLQSKDEDKIVNFICNNNIYKIRTIEKLINEGVYLKSENYIKIIENLISNNHSNEYNRYIYKIYNYSEKNFKLLEMLANNGILVDEYFEKIFKDKEIEKIVDFICKNDTYKVKSIERLINENIFLDIKSIKKIIENLIINNQDNKYNEYIYKIYNYTNKKAGILEIMGNNGILNDELLEIYNNLKLIKSKKKDLETDNEALSNDLLKTELINKFGIDIIIDLLEYNTGAENVLIKNQNDQTLLNWINYLKEDKLYNKKILHYSLLCYDKTKNLFEDLIKNKKIYTEMDLNHLYEIMITNNKYNINSLEEFNNYNNIKKSHFEKEINNSKIVQLTVNKFLCNNENSYFLLNKIQKFHLDNEETIETFCKNGILDLKDKACIKIIREIEHDSKVLGNEEFYEKYSSFGDNIDISFTFNNILKKLTLYYSKLYADKLTNLETIEKNKKVKVSTMKVENDEEILDINNNLIPKNNEIKVIDLNGVPFHILRHRILYSQNDESYKDFAKMLVNDPRYWLYADGTSTISTSYVNNYMSREISTITNRNSHLMTLGFTKIPDDSIFDMGPCDINTTHGYNVINPMGEKNTEFCVPEVLGKKTVTSYNEVAMYRKDKNGKRILPTCILTDNLSFGINKDAIKFAQVFNIPIVIIDSVKYNEINKNNMKKYESHQFTSFDIEDVKNILYSSDKSIEESYKLVIDLLKYSLKNNILDIEKYYLLMDATKKLINDFDYEDILENENILENNEEKYGRAK